MAWRPDKCIIRGEVDNTERGRVVGKLWMVDREEPLLLDLQGDAWPDLAGCKITFTNPSPKAQPHCADLSQDQFGQVGDITASNKRKSFTVPEEEWMQAISEQRVNEVPFVWKNSLYLEWYSSTNGRVVVETCDFEISISERQWETDEDEHQAQQMLNMQAMRDFLGGVIQRVEPKDDGRMPEDMTEEEWEETLKQSDRLTDAAMEAFDKFEHDPDADAKEAFVMGWDHLHDEEEGLADSDDDEVDEDDDSEPEIFNADEEEEAAMLEEYSFERHQHPLQIKARDYGLAATEKLVELGIDRNDDDASTAPNRFGKNVYQIMGKLAGALCHAPGRGQPKGYILAITKRCLNWANDALAALNEISEKHPEAEEELSALRAGLFEIRDGITDLRRELHGE